MYWPAHVQVHLFNNPHGASLSNRQQTVKKRVSAEPPWVRSLASLGTHFGALMNICVYSEFCD